VHIPPGTAIGFDPEQDRARGFMVTEKGITVIAKAEGVEHFLQTEPVEQA
jgi:glucose-1-phosphate adenylyltransferase